VPVLETSDASKPGPGSQDPGNGRACNRGRMLLCDDEESIRLLFEMILTEDLPDVDIDLAGNGREALEMFSQRHHAVLLMDLHMPVMDGQAAFDAVRELCKTRRWAMPAFVFCTGFAPPDTVVKAVEADESPHCLLPKPVCGERLVDTVRTRLT